MIINISRAKDFQGCRVKGHNWDELRLIPRSTPLPLLTGGAFHVGVASFFSGASAAKATEDAEAEYRRRIPEPESLLPEERGLVEHQIELTKRMVSQYAKHYDLGQDFQVLYPEVQFMIPLPDTEHHCWFAHRLLWTSPTDFANERYNLEDNTGCLHKGCYMPHYLRGKTDAVVQWRKMLWLLEHKTSAISGDIFYAKYELDFQISGYIYGIWKSLGVRPHGAILNLVKKPNKKALDQLAITFEREPFLRSEEDLLEFERDITGIAYDYEEAFRLGGRHIYKNPENCIKWNRRCWYHDLCKRNQVQEDGEFTKRQDDYINTAYYELLGLPLPVQGKEENADPLTVPDSVDND